MNSTAQVPDERAVVSTAEYAKLE